MRRNVLKWQTYLFGASFLQHPWASGAVPYRCFFDRFCCTTTWFWVIPCSNRFGLVRMKSCHVSSEVVLKTGEKLSRFVTVYHHLKFEGFEKSYIYFNRLGQDDAVNASPQIFSTRYSQVPLYRHPLIRTPHCYGQFALCLGKESPLRSLWTQPASEYRHPVNKDIFFAPLRVLSKFIVWGRSPEWSKATSFLGGSGGMPCRKFFEMNMRWDAIWCILRHGSVLRHGILTSSALTSSRLDDVSDIVT